MKGKRYVVVITLGLLLALTGCATQSADPQSVNNMANTITVTGFGEARSNPDMATVSIGVNLSDTDIAQVIQESNAQIAEITAALEALGIAEEDIQSTGFNVWPEDLWDPETGQPTGEKRYHVDSTMQINVRVVDDVGKVLETALTHGANTIYGLSFELQNTAALTAEARTAAIANAQDRAEAMAEGFGLTLGEVSSLSDSSGGMVYPYFISAGYGVGGGGGEPPISKGQMAVSVTVTVTFEISR